MDFDDPERWWSDVLGLPPDGAMVVRPDQHIARRWMTTAADMAGTHQVGADTAT